MSRQEAAEQYGKALRAGRKCQKECVHRGRYPYPQVLDEILVGAPMAGQVELGGVEIPMEQIAGTKTAGRRSAFAANFMPLMEPDTEFADKWISLCQAHLGDEGIRDPIRCYEYLGWFYVQEGNKRVSVLKSYDAPSIPGFVIRMVPAWSDSPDILAYYDFMRSYPLTGLYAVRFSRAGSFAKLQAALGYAPDHVWTEEERRQFSSSFTYFRDAFWKRGGRDLPITPADALLVWLKVYPFASLRTMSSQELSRSLEAVWADVRMQTQSAPIAVSTQPPAEELPLLSRLFKLRSPLRVAFVNERSPQESDWARAHDLGRQYLETVLEEAVDVQVFNGVRTEAEADEAIDAAAAGGAQVIFATTPPLIGACRRAAAKYPDLRILNCSVSMAYTGVRTYYSRIYEGKFITGAIAGAMSPSGNIGYVASSPIFGVPASINAFALGARMTNPNARIRLRWSCVEPDAMEALVRDGMDLVSNRDIPTPDRTREPWGLCRPLKTGGFASLASPYWHWGNFYVRLIRSFLNGGWDAAQNGGKAVNYWWGMDSQAVGVLLGEALPAGVRQLAGILSNGIYAGSVFPFLQPIRSQDGAERSNGDHWFTPEEILRMDWLCDNVDGAIPAYESLLPFARSIVRLQGVYRDHIPPEKEGTIL